MKFLSKKYINLKLTFIDLPVTYRKRSSRNVGRLWAQFYYKLILYSNLQDVFKLKSSNQVTWLLDKDLLP